MCPQGGWVDVLDLSNSVIFYRQVIRHQLPWNLLPSQPMGNALTVPEQTTPASSTCLQSCCPQPWEGHLHTWDSFPPQFSSSSQMGLIPDLIQQIARHWGLVHSPAACTPRGHRPGPSRHHRWCPRSPGQGSPLSRCRDLLRPPGGAVCCLRREKWDNRGLTGA